MKFSENVAGQLVFSRKFRGKGELTRFSGMGLENKYVRKCQSSKESEQLTRNIPISGLDGRVFPLFRIVFRLHFPLMKNLRVMTDRRVKNGFSSSPCILIFIDYSAYVLSENDYPIQKCVFAMHPYKVAPAGSPIIFQVRCRDQMNKGRDEYCDASLCA